jgi:hypothetical protein
LIPIGNESRPPPDYISLCGMTTVPPRRLRTQQCAIERQWLGPYCHPQVDSNSRANRRRRGTVWKSAGSRPVVGTARHYSLQCTSISSVPASMPISAYESCLEVRDSAVFEPTSNCAIHLYNCSIAEFSTPLQYDVTGLDATLGNSHGAPVYTPSLGQSWSTNNFQCY